jgi:hypothetical protein
VKYSQPSNKKLIKNAITSVCLAGVVNKLEREKVIAYLETSCANPTTKNPTALSLNSATYYIILLEASLGRKKFRGLYSHDGSGWVQKIYGGSKAPNEITEDIVGKYFRYDSGAKEFKEIVGMKRFNVSTDAVSLLPKQETSKVHKYESGGIPEVNMPMPKFNVE